MCNSIVRITKLLSSAHPVHCMGTFELQRLKLQGWGRGWDGMGGEGRGLASEDTNQYLSWFRPTVQIPKLHLSFPPKSQFLFTVIKSGMHALLNVIYWMQLKTVSFHQIKQKVFPLPPSYLTLGCFVCFFSVQQGPPSSPLVNIKYKEQVGFFFEGYLPQILLFDLSHSVISLNLAKQRFTHRFIVITLFSSSL